MGLHVGYDAIRCNQKAPQKFPERGKIVARRRRVNQRESENEEDIILIIVFSPRREPGLVQSQLQLEISREQPALLAKRRARLLISRKRINSISEVSSSGEHTTSCRRRKIVLLLFFSAEILISNRNSQRISIQNDPQTHPAIRPIFF